MRKAHAKATTSGDAHRLVLESDLTIYNAPGHKRALLDALEQAKVVELDLAKVGEIDSAGLQVLLLAKRESLASGKEMRILRHSPPVQELMEFFNVASYFGDPLVIPAGKKA